MVVSGCNDHDNSTLYCSFSSDSGSSTRGWELELLILFMYFWHGNYKIMLFPSIGRLT